MRRKPVVVLLVVIVAAAAAWAAESRSLAKSAVPLTRRDAIRDFANGLRVESPEQYRNLTIYPVVASGIVVPPVDLPLDRAVAKDLVQVLELDESEVNELTVRSRAKEPVFAMAGEMLRGGKQDRIIAQDLVIPPQCKIEVAVYCVEHGRWAHAEGAPAAFSAGRSMAGSAVRRAGGAGGGGRGGGGQGAVWSEVEKSQERLAAPSATGALRSVHDSAAVQKQIAPYQRALREVPGEHPKANGVVVVVDGEILAADLFGSSALFRQLWPQLLEAYAIDAVEHETATEHEVHAKHGIATAEVQHWLMGMVDAERVRRDTPGEGTVYQLRGHRLAGSALVWQQGIVHVELFPGEAEPATEFNSLQFRREQIERSRD